MGKREQIIECINYLEEGQMKMEQQGDIWQNKLVWWICKALCMILVDKLREEKK